MSRSRSATLALVLAAGFAMVTADLADARVGGGGSFGSRGGRTYTTPPQTNTAPKAAPIEKSMTQKGAPTAQSTPGASTVGQASRFGGWRGLLMGGLIAAGLASIFGFGALASVLGFVLQAALIAGAVYLVVAFIRSRNQPALARASAQSNANQAPRNAERPQGMASFGSAAPSTSALAIEKSDLDTF